MIAHRTHLTDGKRRIVLALCILCAFLFQATDSVGETLLSLDDAIDIALEHSYSMKTIRLTLAQSEQDYLAAKYQFRTNASMNFDTPHWSEQVTSVQVPNDLPIYNNLGTLRYEGNLYINQPLPTDGTLSFRSSLYQSKETNYFAETDNTIKRKDFLTSLSIFYTQPLFTYNRLQTGLKRAELNYESASLSFSRTQLDVMYNVTQSFFALYRLTRTYEINKETLQQKEQAHELAKLKFEAGLIPEVEALQMEVDLADAQAALYESEAELERQKDLFKQTIGLELKEYVGIETSISYTHFPIDEKLAVEKGLENRYEIRERKIAIELQKINLKAVDANSEISADLTAFYNFTGYSDQSLPYSTSAGDLFDSSWRDLERRPGNRGVTLRFNIPIWDWGVNKAEVASATQRIKQAEINLAEEQKDVESSVRDAVRTVKTAEKRLEVYKLSQDVAQRTYDISMARFNNGEITSQELALDHTRLTTAKLQFLGAYITYKLAISDLKRKTLWDFELNRSARER